MVKCISHFIIILKVTKNVDTKSKIFHLICVAVSECCTIHRSENQNQSNYNYPSEKKVDVILRELKVDTGNLLEARENTSEQVGAGLSLAFNWLRQWREFGRPITERSKTKAIQITFATKLKTSHALERAKSLISYPSL